MIFLFCKISGNHFPSLFYSFSQLHPADTGDWFQLGALHKWMSPAITAQPLLLETISIYSLQAYDLTLLFLKDSLKEEFSHAKLMLNTQMVIYFTID